MKHLLPVLLALLLSACVPSRQTAYIRQHQTLLFGSDAAIMQGCVRGVVRWHHQTTGQYLDAEGLRQMAELCTGVQFSFRDQYGDGSNT